MHFCGIEKSNGRIHVYISKGTSLWKKLVIFYAIYEKIWSNQLGNFFLIQICKGSGSFNMQIILFVIENLIKCLMKHKMQLNMDKMLLYSIFAPKIVTTFYSSATKFNIVKVMYWCIENESALLRACKELLNF